MPDPLTRAPPAPRGAPRPRWGVPTGGRLSLCEAHAYRARKDRREQTRAESRSIRSGGDHRERRWTGAPQIKHPDHMSPAAVFASFTSTLRSEYAEAFRCRGETNGSIPRVRSSLSSTHLGYGSEKAEAEEETIPAYRLGSSSSSHVSAPPPTARDLYDESSIVWQTEVPPASLLRERHPYTSSARPSSAPHDRWGAKSPTLYPESWSFEPILASKIDVRAKLHRASPVPVVARHARRDGRW
jgi:hypothetical protein